MICCGDVEVAFPKSRGDTASPETTNRRKHIEKGLHSPAILWYK
jgi:hypothetical protein